MKTVNTPFKYHFISKIQSLIIQIFEYMFFWFVYLPVHLSLPLPRRGVVLQTCTVSLFRNACTCSWSTPGAGSALSTTCRCKLACQGCHYFSTWPLIFVWSLKSRLLKRYFWALVDREYFWGGQRGRRREHGSNIEILETAWELKKTVDQQHL